MGEQRRCCGTEAPDRSAHRGSGAVVGVLAVGWLVLPFAGVLAGRAPFAMLNALVGDTYYYLVIARNTVRHGFPSFDGETATNGFMPLWQGIVVVLMALTGGADRPPTAMMETVFLASLALCALGVGLLAAFLGNRLGALRAAALLPLFLPGAVFWLFEPAWRFEPPDGITYGLAPWSWVNGMESGVGLVLFALLVPLLARLGEGRALSGSTALTLGLLCWLVAMARLDDVFLGVAVFVPVAIAAWRARDPRPALAFAAVPVAGCVLYVLANLAAVGAALPTSGTAKTALLSWPTGLAEFGRLGSFRPEAQRLLPLCAGLGIGAVALALGAGLGGWRAGLCRVLGLYLVLKGLFLLSSVPLAHQGGWYYTLMIASANLLVLLAAADRLAGLSRGALAALFAFGMAALWPTAQASRHGMETIVAGSLSALQQTLCGDGTGIRARLADAAGQPEHALRIIDGGDGVYAWCLDLPAQSVTALVSSPQVLAERRELGLFPAARRRGFGIVAGGAVPWGNYRFREIAEIQGFRVVEILAHREIRFWRVEPDPQAAGAAGSAAGAD